MAAMKSTGVVRRIDDLGRITIPKEIRRICKLKEDDAVEFFLSTRNGETTVQLRKYKTEFLASVESLSDSIIDELMNHGEYEKRNAIRSHFDEIAKIIKEFEIRG